MMKQKILIALSITACSNISVAMKQEPPYAKELTTWNQTALHDIFEQPATNLLFSHMPHDVRQLVKRLTIEGLNQKRDLFIQSYKNNPQEGIEYAAEHHVYDFPMCREAFKKLGASLSLITCVQQNKPSSVACLLENGENPHAFGEFKELGLRKKDGKETILTIHRGALEHALLHRYSEIAALLIKHTKGIIKGWWSRTHQENYFGEGNVCYNGHDEPLSGPKLSKETVKQFNAKGIHACSLFELACIQKCQSHLLVAKTPQELTEYERFDGIPRLFIAAFHGDIQAVKACIEAGDSVNALVEEKDKFFNSLSDVMNISSFYGFSRGISAINIAIKHGDIGVVSLLLDNDAYNFNIIHDAAENEHLEMVLFLLRRQRHKATSLYISKTDIDAIVPLLTNCKHSQAKRFELLKELLVFQLPDVSKKSIMGIAKIYGEDISTEPIRQAAV